MEIRKPTYYDTFRCIAGSCPDSCCKEWAVTVDDASAARYRSLTGPLGDDLRRVMEEEDGDTILALTPDGRCPMWRDDGLCRIQAQLGEEALCHTCSQFPRLRHDYGNFVELGLELSCPEAARLIFTGDSTPVITELPGGEDADYDTELMEILLRTRAEFLAYLETTEDTPREILAVLLLYGYRVQEELDGGEPAELDAAAALNTAKSFPYQGNAEALLAFYRELEILTPRWRQRLETLSPGPWSEEHRALIRYFVERHWLQAVSDYDLVGRVKFIIASCLMIRNLGGDLPETAQLYSKEIENDGDNLAAIFDGAYTHPALADLSLLGLLLEESS